MDKNIVDQAVNAYISMVDMTTAFMWPLKLSGDELPTSHIGVLHELKFQGSMNLTQLSQQVSVAKQTMTDISTKLIKLGYVERIQNENNRRQILLQLTPEGNAFLEEYLHARFQYIRDHVFSSLSEEQLRLLRESCQTLCELQSLTIIGDKYGHRDLGF